MLANISQYLLEFWELALEDAPKDPDVHHSMLEREAKTHPGLLAGATDLYAQKAES